jgi:hypothetical protein
MANLMHSHKWCSRGRMPKGRPLVISSSLRAGWTVRRGRDCCQAIAGLGYCRSHVCSQTRAPIRFTMHGLGPGSIPDAGIPQRAIGDWGIVSDSTEMTIAKRLNLKCGGKDGRCVLQGRAGGVETRVALRLITLRTTLVAICPLREGRVGGKPLESAPLKYRCSERAACLLPGRATKNWMSRAKPLTPSRLCWCARPASLDRPARSRAVHDGPSVIQSLCQRGASCYRLHAAVPPVDHWNSVFSALSVPYSKSSPRDITFPRLKMRPPPSLLIRWNRDALFVSADKRPILKNGGRSRF